MLVHLSMQAGGAPCPATLIPCLRCIRQLEPHTQALVTFVTLNDAQGMSLLVMQLAAPRTRLQHTHGG